MKKLFRLISLIIFPSVLYTQSTTFHTGPEISFLFNQKSERVYYSDTINKINVSPRLFGVSRLNKKIRYNSYVLGLNLSANIGKDFRIVSSYDKIGGEYTLLTSNFFDSLLVAPSFYQSNRRLQFNFQYTINTFFRIDAGKGRNFIGDGYRSLLLSSSHAPYPFLRLRTEFGPFRYYNLYTTFVDMQDPLRDRKKHAAIHFLDFQLNKNINIGVFEGVVWESKNETYYRGYDVEYLNPIIFYRPVEFSKHSPDNVLMGVSFNASFLRNILYGQLLLDDLNISRQKDQDASYQGGFFQNKFAFQLGLRGKFIKSLDFLIEYNQAQPYTYAHKEPMQSYTHLNQALAHPIGANFKEMVLLASYQYNQLSVNLSFIDLKVGIDSNETHYGQNILISDFEAEGDGQQYSYGNFNGQGILTNIHGFNTEIIYSLNSVDIFGSIYYKKEKSDLLDQTSLYYSLGIRTFPFDSFRDY